MSFDKERALTVFTRDKAKNGDIGWVASDEEFLMKKYETEPPEKLWAVSPEGGKYPFVMGSGNIGMFFYPASYKHLQFRWVKDNDLKVGDKVKIIRKWEKGDKGFERAGDPSTEVGSIREVYVIDYDYIIVKDPFANIHVAEFVPYFAIEKVKDEYRPFNMEEFAIYRNRWWGHKETGDKVRFDQYCEDGLLNTFRGLLTWQELLDEFTDEQDNPAGIKL